MRERTDGQSWELNRGTVVGLEQWTGQIANVQQTFAEALHDSADAMATINEDAAAQLYRAAGIANASAHALRQAGSPQHNLERLAYALGWRCAAMLHSLLKFL